MAIELKGICKSYDGKPVLDGVNLILKQGEIACIMGVSGIGKTTLVNILLGLTAPDRGEIIGLPANISAVFQEDRLLPWETALSNVLFVKNPARSHVKEAEALLSRMGLGDSIYKKAAELSGGMKRRVCICRALIAGGDLLVLDEPFKGLDDETKFGVMDMVKAYAKDRYVLCVTHDGAEVEYLGGRLVSWQR